MTTASSPFHSFAPASHFYVLSIVNRVFFPESVDFHFISGGFASGSPIAKLFYSRSASMRDSTGESDPVQSSCSARDRPENRVTFIMFAQYRVSPPRLRSPCPSCAASHLAFYRGSLGMPMSPLFLDRRGLLPANLTYSLLRARASEDVSA